MFPRDRVITSLKKYGIEYTDDEETEVLRERLAAFYGERTLTKKAITRGQQTEAIFQLLSSKFKNTTGHIIPVDGGLKEAFLR